MKTIKLTLSEWLVKELRYYETHHKIDINDFIFKSLAEYLVNTENIGLAVITPVNSKKKAEIEVEVSEIFILALQKAVKRLSHCKERVIDSSDVINSALAFTMPNLISIMENEEIICLEAVTRGCYHLTVYLNLGLQE